jgi:hypothetical protein
MYTDVHSFFSSWTSVYGYATNLPTDYNKLLGLMQRAQSAILQVNRETFAIGTAARVIGPASGGTDDYAYSLGISASFTVELRGNSFIAPVSDIPIAGDELLAGAVAIANALQGNSVSQTGIQPLLLFLMLIMATMLLM